MARELMVPILPCSSVDEIRDFYLALGFEVTYRQLKPNPYLCLRREDLQLHYFGLDQFRPEDSYSTCLVLVEDTGALFEAFAAGLRGRYGKVPLTGFPRITRPRPRKNAGERSGFSLIDPSGNWIRIMRQEPAIHQETAVHQETARSPGVPAGPGRVGRALADAVVLADSKGDVGQAAKILAGALARTAQDPAGAGAGDGTERIEALAFLTELYLRLDRYPEAASRLGDLEALELPAEIMAQAEELRRQLAGHLPLPAPDSGATL